MPSSFTFCRVSLRQGLSLKLELEFLWLGCRLSTSPVSFALVTVMCGAKPGLLLCGFWDPNSVPDWHQPYYTACLGFELILYLLPSQYHQCKHGFIL